MKNFNSPLAFQYWENNTPNAVLKQPINGKIINYTLPKQVKSRERLLTQ
jgi:hypothetical protein